jgi:hypothetical protein
MKSLDSAEHSVERLPDGRLRAWIRHDTMKGVTPEILRWWFEHIDGFTTFNGEDFSGPEVPVYRYWHPFDHIAVSWARRVRGPDGHLAPGSVIYIQENIGARYPVRAKARVTRFDEEAFNFDLLLGGLIRVGSLDHEYAAVEGGCSFYTHLLIGTTLPLIGSLLNWAIRKMAFSDALVRAWILHNIEESGETEKFVPKLFTHARESG